MPKIILVTARPDGTSSVEAIGFTGKTCDAPAAIFEAALGGPAAITSRTNKPEYDQPARLNGSQTTHHHQQQQLGS